MSRCFAALALALYLATTIGGAWLHGLETCHHDGLPAADGSSEIQATPPASGGHDHAPLCPHHRDCRTCQILSEPGLHATTGTMENPPPLLPPSGPLAPVVYLAPRSTHASRAPPIAPA